MRVYPRSIFKSPIFLKAYAHIRRTHVLRWNGTGVDDIDQTTIKKEVYV